MSSVTACKMEVVTEKSGHTMTGMAVSVCLTPAAPSPVPIPYPTVGTSGEGITDPCMRTKINGAKVLTVGGCLKACHGNEAGTLKEVVSLNTAGPCFPALGAPIVFIELGMAGITGSIGQMNKSITVGAGASASGAGGGAGGGGGGGGGGSGPGGGSSQGPSQGGGGGGGSNEGAGSPDAPAPPEAEGQAKAGHPVDIVTGTVYTLPAVDFQLDGPLPMQWVRQYRSSAVERNAGMGWGWSHAFGWRAEQGARGLFLYDSEGSPSELADIGDGELAVLPFGRSLRREGSDLILATRDATERLLRRGHDGVYRMVAMRDRAGNRTELVWERGAVARVIDCLGRRAEREPTPGGEVWHLVVTDDQGKEHKSFAVGYEWDARGDLVRVVDGGGGVTEYAYDEAHFLLSERRPDGMVYRFVYQVFADGKRRCVETWGEMEGRDLLSELGRGVSYHAAGTKGVFHYRLRYEPEHRRTTVVDAMGGVHRYQGNKLGLVEKYVDPRGQTTKLRYDARGFLRSITNPLGKRELRVCDGMGRLTGFVDALRRRTSYLRDERGDIVELTDAGGTKWIMRHKDGRLVERVDPAGRKTTCVYDARGLAVATSGPGGTEKVERDDHGNPVAVTNVQGATWKYTWDLLGYPVRVETPRGGIYAFQYDSRGHIVVVDGPLGQKVTREFDAIGRVTAEQHPSGGVSEYRYLAGKLVERVYPNGEQFRYGYDALLRLRSVENAAGERHLFDYDENHNVVRETTFGGQEYRYEYDAADRRIAEIRPNGAVLRYRYDAAGQLVAREVDGGYAESFERDVRGAVVRASTPFCSVSFLRDGMGALVRETHATAAWEFGVEHDKDALGRTLRTRYSSGWGLRRSRGNGGALSGLAVEGAEGVFEEVLHVEQAGDEEIVRRLDSGMAMVHERDVLGRIVRTDLKSPEGETLRRRQYSWSRMPALAEVRDSRLGSRRYAIDLLARPTEAQGLGTREHFDYSPQGTPLTSTTQVGRAGRPTTVNGETLVWDRAGRLQTRSGDAPQRSWTYEYDFDDRLVAARRGDGDTIRYFYDPFGRLIQIDHGRGASTFFGYDGQCIVEARGTQGFTRRYVYREDGYTPLLDSLRPGSWRLVATDEAATPWLYVAADGSMAEVDFTTWGKVAHKEGEIGSLRFAGQHADDATGLYYNRHRHYAPDLGLYTTPDPLGLRGSTFDIGFVPNPTGFVDPLGLIIILACEDDDEVTNAGNARQGAAKRPDGTNQEIVTARDVREGRVDLGNLQPGEGVEVITHGTRRGGQVVWDDGTPPPAGMNHRLVNGRGLGKALKKAGLQPGTEVAVVACNASARPTSASGNQQESVIEGVSAATGAPTAGPSGLAFVRPDPQASPGTPGSVDLTDGQWDRATTSGGTTTVTQNSPPTTAPGTW